MIPKIIHYCWISGDPFPKKIQKCVNSWKKNLPDYEIVVWDYEKVHALNVRWCEEAMACKKYAFVADYVRFYALYNYGGIYLDSDVEVIKPFDDLLNLRYFAGAENDPTNLGWGEAAVLGAEKGLEWVKCCLDRYKDRPFLTGNGKMDITPLPQVMKDVLCKNHYQTVDCLSITDWKWNREVICRFPYDWFSPIYWRTMKYTLTENTYTVHHFAGSWHPDAQQKRTEEARLRAQHPIIGLLYYLPTILSRKITKKFNLR